MRDKRLSSSAVLASLLFFFWADAAWACSVDGFVVWADSRPAPGANIYLSLHEEGELSLRKSLRVDERGRFTLRVYEGLAYVVSAYPMNATGAAPQSKWVEVPGAPAAEPIKLILPILKK